MNILGVELELDLLDADVMEAYERESKIVVDRVKSGDGKYEGMSTPDAMRFQCGVINEFFDSLCGDGTAEKLFKGKNNLRDHMEAFAMVTNLVSESNDEFEGLVDKYTPNRAERRQEQKRQQKQNSKNYQRNYSGRNRKNGGKGRK